MGLWPVGGALAEGLMHGFKPRENRIRRSGSRRGSVKNLTGRRDEMDMRIWFALVKKSVACLDARETRQTCTATPRTFCHRQARKASECRNARFATAATGM